MSWAAPKRMSAMSFSVTAGRLLLMPGMFTFFREPRLPPVRTTHRITWPATDTTSRSIVPSAIRMCVPGAACRGRSP